MEWPSNMPDFLTELMRQWLKYEISERIEEITALGLFHWEYRPNRRNPNKPRRIPSIDQRVVLKDAKFKNAYYFLQIDARTLHVYQTSGFPKAGFSRAIEYVLEDESFVQKNTLMKMIS